MVRALNETSFRSAVLETPGTAVVDFWAPWCPHCPAMLGVLKEVAAGFDGATFGSVDVGDHPDLAAGNRISGIPAVLFYKDGREVRRLTGVHSPAAVRRVLESIR